ncbi:MAG: DUF6543 domain-containing protein [Luteibacter sp.]
MDSTPPQSPPAIVADSQQETIDGLRRLVAYQSWLIDQQHALPLLPPDPRPETRESYLDRLDAFWREPIEDAPGTPSLPRTDVLATRLAATMRDEAVVRGRDGTLDASAARLAGKFARALGGGLPPGLEARALRVGDVDYAGAIVVQDRNDASIVLRFLPERGWDAFDNLEQLHAATETLWRERLAGTRVLPGVRLDDLDRVIADERFVGSAPIADDPFIHIAQRLIALQREKVADAWPAGDERSSAAVVDELHAALSLLDKAGVASMLAERESRLRVALNERRLAQVPADVALGWRQAVGSYRTALASMVAGAQRHDGDAPLGLADWSRRELTAALVKRGVTVDPDEIQVEVGESVLPAPFAVPPPGGSASPTRLGMADFALRNTSHLDGRSLRVVTPTANAPDVGTLRAVAREVDLAPRFAAYLRSQVGDPQGRSLRIAAMRLQQARMRIAAADARLASYVPGETASFIDDREDRGYRMVEAVLDAPVAATRRTVGGHRIAVHQLVYEGAAVEDVLVIGVQDPRSSPRVVLYTPDAPDGRDFHEFGDRAAAAREFLYAPAFEEYLLRRLPVEFSEPLPNGTRRRFRVSEATRRAHWSLAAPGNGRATLVEAPFTERLVDGDVRTALFDASIVRQARDVSWLGRSASQADVDAIAAAAGMLPRTTLGPAALIEDTLSAVGQALRATWRLYDSVKAGDTGQAVVDFTEAYVASLGVAGWKTGTSRLSLRGSGSTARRVDAGLKIVDGRQRLDPRYALQGVDLNGSPVDALGVHRLGGRRFIRQQELVFEVRHDPGTGSWRLARPGAPDRAFAGPAVEPTLAGGWRYRTDIGLRGGWVDETAFPQPQTRGVAGSDLAGLSDFQRWTFERSFETRLRNAGEARLIYWDATSQTTPRFVTLRQRTAWSDALRTARAAPASPLPLGSQPPVGATWRVLPVDEWPATLWHYPSSFAGFIGADGSQVLPLQVMPGSGLRGLPASVQAPPARVLSMPTGNVPGSRSQDWVQFHLDRYRGRTRDSGLPVIRIIEDRRGPEPTYVIQPDQGFQINFLGLEAADFSAGRQALP